MANEQGTGGGGGGHITYYRTAPINPGPYGDDTDYRGGWAVYGGSPSGGGGTQTAQQTNTAVNAVSAWLSGTQTGPTPYFADFSADQGTLGQETARGARVYATSTQTIGSSTATAATFDTAMYDDRHFWSSAAPTRFSIPSGYGGRYEVGAHIKLDANSSGDRGIQFRINGSSQAVTGTMVKAPTSSNAAELNVTGQIELSAGAYVEVYVFQDCGANLGTVLQSNSPSMWISKEK